MKIGVTAAENSALPSEKSIKLKKEIIAIIFHNISICTLFLFLNKINAPLVSIKDFFKKLLYREFQFILLACIQIHNVFVHPACYINPKSGIYKAFSIQFWLAAKPAIYIQPLWYIPLTSDKPENCSKAHPTVQPVYSLLPSVGTFIWIPSLIISQHPLSLVGSKRGGCIQKPLFPLLQQRKSQTYDLDPPLQLL